MSRKSLVEVRREQILQGFERCVIKYGLDTSLEQIAAETGVQRSIIRHYIGNRDELVEALMDRITQAYVEDIRVSIATIVDARSETRLLDYLFDVKEDYGDWDRAIVNVLVTSKERFPNAKQKLQRMFGEAIEMITHALTLLYEDAAPEQCSRVGYALFCLVTTHETVQWIGFSDDRHTQARESAALLLQTLKPDNDVCPVCADSR